MKGRFAVTAAFAVVGLLASAGVASASAPPAATAARAATAVTAKPPATFIGVSWAPAERTRIAVYSASTGKRVKFLTAVEKGFGVLDPMMSANGKTVAFVRGLSLPCGERIDKVATSGGPERVLVPVAGSGKTAAYPFAASFSADGKFLIYATYTCSGWHQVHLRNLSTGATTEKHGSIQSPAVFIDNDTRVVFLNGRNLDVLTLSTLRVEQFRARQVGCGYNALSGTASKLIALLSCNPRNQLSVVAISATKFDAYKTLASLGTCQLGESVSVAQSDPSALLVQTQSTCHSVTGEVPTLRTFTVINGKVTLLQQGTKFGLPASPVW